MSKLALLELGSIILAVILLAAITRMSTKDHEVDRHDIFCVGFCTHTEDVDHTEEGPDVHTATGTTEHRATVHIPKLLDVEIGDKTEEASH